jgi:hypothetical protein
VAGHDVVCLSFLHFTGKALKQRVSFYLYSCKTMKPHSHALTLSKKYEIVSFWESHKHLRQKDIAQRFCIPTSTLGGKLKNATKIKQSFENSSYSADAVRHKKTKFDNVNVVCWPGLRKRE